MFRWQGKAITAQNEGKALLVVHHYQNQCSPWSKPERSSLQHLIHAIAKIHLLYLYCVCGKKGTSASKQRWLFVMLKSPTSTLVFHPDTVQVPIWHCWNCFTADILLHLIQDMKEETVPRAVDRPDRSDSCEALVLGKIASKQLEALD